MKLLMVAAGGAVGSVLRYWISGWVQSVDATGLFPFGTLTVNAAGCLVIGFASQLIEDRGFLGPDGRALLLVGVLGGLTTFSTFANETMNSLRDGAAGLALLNVGAQIILGLMAVWVGRLFAYWIWS